MIFKILKLIVQRCDTDCKHTGQCNAVKKYTQGSVGAQRKKRTILGGKREIAIREGFPEAVTPESNLLFLRM